MDCSELILLLLKDSNLLVALNSSWALGNLADTLDKNKLVLLCFYCVCVRVLYLFIKKTVVCVYLNLGIRFSKNYPLVS